MDWLTGLNQALDYIENNLENDIDYNQAAKIACCSTYHFQRMFAFIANVSLSEYIRRRRLTLAAFELQNSDTKIIDVTLKYGYDAPESFSRAFKALHGVTPSLVCGKNVTIKAYPRISFRISIKGDVEMNYRIEEKPAFTIFGVEKFINMEDGANFKEIPEFWGEFLGSDESKRPPIDEDAHSWHAILSYEDWQDGKMPYMIFTPKKDGMDSTGFKELTVPAAEWAIFTTDVVKYITEPLQEIWKRIFEEWFPTSNYEHAPLPECEFYYEVEGGEYAEVWIPVIKKTGGQIK